jgi:hypothetical protein
VSYPAMSALGQKQTLRHLRPMSALPPKADMDQSGCDVRFVPQLDSLAHAISQQRPHSPGTHRAGGVDEMPRKGRRLLLDLKSNRDVCFLGLGAGEFL